MMSGPLPLLLATALAVAISGCAIPAATPSALSRIAVTRDASGAARASVPSCPGWSRSSTEDFSNRDMANFGCADAINFAAQLADPLDAARGRGSDAGDGGTAADAVLRYRTGKTRALGGSGSQGGASAPAAAPGGGA